VAHISLDKQQLSSPCDQEEERLIRKSLSHPIRLRILALLSAHGPAAQHTLAKQLVMSNAALHHHMANLLELGFTSLVETRQCPNGILEKVYGLDVDQWDRWRERFLEEKDFGECLDYALAWVAERHREGSDLLKRTPQPFIVGSLAVKTSPAALAEFQSEIRELCERFRLACSDRPPSEGDKCSSITFSLFPSHEQGIDDSQNILEYEC